MTFHTQESSLSQSFSFPNSWHVYEYPNSLVARFSPLARQISNPSLDYTLHSLLHLKSYLGSQVLA